MKERSFKHHRDYQNDGSDEIESAFNMVNTVTLNTSLRVKMLAKVIAGVAGRPLGLPLGKEGADSLFAVIDSLEAVAEDLAAAYEAMDTATTLQSKESEEK